MADPRLNSIHLDDVRREEFRRAREALLSARGQHTLAAEERDAWLTSHPHTLVQNPGNVTPPNLKCWLMDKEFIYPLRPGLNTVGRAPDNDVVVPDAYVSRRHCAILVHTGDGYELHDIASKNGTWINGKRLAGPTPLHSGDEIRMCERQFIFLTKGDAAAPPGQMPTLTE
jgi:hypothetical protein